MIFTKTLPNGIRVITDEMKDIETVSMGVWVGVGARYEEPEINGISHLLEHMAFKGTSNRSALQIVQQIEDVGGIVNAYTSYDVTAFYVKLLKDNAALGLDILSDMLQNSVMLPEELDKEKDVVIQEIGQTYDAPDDAVGEYFQSTAFPNQSIGRSVLGTEKTVRSISSETLLNYLHSEYTGPRMTISACGNISHEYFEQEVERLFRSVKTDGGRQIQPANYVGGDFRQQKENEQVNLILGFEGVPYAHPLYNAQRVFAVVMGGGMSSRLFQEIREKRGLVYSIYAGIAPYKDTAILSIAAGTGEEKVAELLPVVCDELLTAGDSFIQEEIDRAKSQIKAQILMSMESSSARCERNALSMQVYDRIIPTSETIEKIDAVNKDMLIEYNKHLLKSRPTLATLGPVKNVISYDELCKKITG